MTPMSLEEYLRDLRKQSPEKCQRCECLYADYRKGPEGVGWYYVCETAPECYQDEPLNKTKGTKTP